jgi:LacI family transcriptional regulator
MKSRLKSIPGVALFITGDRHYERELLHGISDYANRHGPWQFYRNVSYLFGEEKDSAQLLRLWRPQAIIAREGLPDQFEHLFGSRLPMIYSPIIACRKEVANIVVNDAAVGRMAADHLLGAGFRHFAYCGVDTFFWSRLRAAGWSARLDCHGHEVTEFATHSGREYFAWDPKHHLFLQWLKQLPKPVGIFCGTDDFVLPIEDACRRAGLHIPDVVGIIGVGNDESICNLARVSQTSVRLNIRRGGYDAARYLADLLQGAGNRKRKPENIVVEPIGVATRQSTDITQTQDSAVARAITFIRQHVNSPLQVDDVVAATHLSRRRLYDRFLEVTGKNLFAYIRDQRLEHFARLLVETNMSVAEIAYSMGYESATNVARLFKKHFKINPLAYRKRHSIL